MDAPPKPTVTAERERPCEVKKDDFLSPLGGLYNRASDMAVLFTEQNKVRDKTESQKYYKKT